MALDYAVVIDSLINPKEDDFVTDHVYNIA